MALASMRKAAFALLGVVILGITTGAAYRELMSTSKGAGVQSAHETAATDGAPAAEGAGSARRVPNLRFVDGAGSPRSLADFRGRVILLNLWATWCVPCREEMPALDRLHAALGGLEFEVLALSLDQAGVVAVRKFYEELNLRALHIYVDQNGDALRKLGSVGVPLTLLIDRDGRERWRVLGPREWDQPAEVDRIRSHLDRSSRR